MMLRSLPDLYRVWEPGYADVQTNGLHVNAPIEVLFFVILAVWAVILLVSLGHLMIDRNPHPRYLPLAVLSFMHLVFPPLAVIYAVVALYVVSPIAAVWGLREAIQWGRTLPVKRKARRLLREKQLQQDYEDVVRMISE